MSYPVPRHTHDTPGPVPPAHNNPTESEELLKKRKFIFAGWLDNMTPDAVKKLWKKRQAEESSS
jgi:hypothetical protein